MPYFTIITFNTYGKKLSNTLLTVFKTSDETVPMITCDLSVMNTQLFILFVSYQSPELDKFKKGYEV